MLLPLMINILVALLVIKLTFHGLVIFCVNRSTIDEYIYVHSDLRSTPIEDNMYLLDLRLLVICVTNCSAWPCAPLYSSWCVPSHNLCSCILLPWYSLSFICQSCRWFLVPFFSCMLSLSLPLMYILFFQSLSCYVLELYLMSDGF